MKTPIGNSEGDPRSASEQTPGGASSAEDKRVAARRRFLKMGAGGSAAMVVTITHRRAYAAKKGAVASVCASVVGPPDIKGITAKKAIELSTVGGGYKNVYCPVEKPGNCSAAPDKDNSKYFATPADIDGTLVQEDFGNDKNVPGRFVKVQYWEHGLKDGCGDFQETLDKSYAYRLYKEGYCPVVLDQNTGRLKYEVRQYYEEKGCDPNKAGTGPYSDCYTNNKGESKMFEEHTCTPTVSPP